MQILVPLMTMVVNAAEEPPASGGGARRSRRMAIDAGRKPGGGMLDGGSDEWDRKARAVKLRKQTFR